MAIQLAPITIVIERNVARVKTDKGRRRRAVRRRERRREKMGTGGWVQYGYSTGLATVSLHCGRRERCECETANLCQCLKDHKPLGFLFSGLEAPKCLL